MIKGVFKGYKIVIHNRTVLVSDRRNNAVISGSAREVSDYLVNQCINRK